MSDPILVNFNSETLAPRNSAEFRDISSNSTFEFVQNVGNEYEIAKRRFGIFA